MRFEWDGRKNKANVKKHGVSFEFAAHVFADPLRKEGHDAKHSSPKEERLIAVGVAGDRLLFVSFTEPGEDVVRIISARKANSRERRRYYGNG